MPLSSREAVAAILIVVCVVTLAVSLISQEFSPSVGLSLATIAATSVTAIVVITALERIQDLVPQLGQLVQDTGNVVDHSISNAREVVKDWGTTNTRIVTETEAATKRVLEEAENTANSVVERSVKTVFRGFVQIAEGLVRILSFQNFTRGAQDFDSSAVSQLQILSPPDPDHLSSEIDPDRMKIVSRRFSNMEEINNLRPSTSFIPTSQRELRRDTYFSPNQSYDRN